MWLPIGGNRPRALAGGLIGFGVVLLLTAGRLPDWRALTFVGVALIVPSVVWLVANRRIARPWRAWWWVIVGLAVAMGVWGLALFPGPEQVPYRGVR